uniref:Uncharacterized protein n=1 Tax=Parascaris equorum TaxID=6256 RepID=A0A914RJK3_PAREQ
MAAFHYLKLRVAYKISLSQANISRTSVLSGVLSTLLEIGERGPGSRGSAVLVARSGIPYVPAAFETPVIRRVQSVRWSSSTKDDALHGGELATHLKF